MENGGMIQGFDFTNICVMIGSDYSNYCFDKSVIKHIYVENSMHPIEQVEYIRAYFTTYKGGKEIFVTQSPYILRAIEMYTAVNRIADKVKYYDTYNDLKDITTNTEIAYAKMAKPLELLQKIEYNLGEYNND